MKQEDDLDKLNYYLNAKFKMQGSIVFSNIIRLPSNLGDLINKLKKSEIEHLYNGLVA